MLTLGHIVSLVITLSLIIVLGWVSTLRVKSGSDFMVGDHQAGVMTVAGILTGTLIGGVSTIGGAQMGFLYGFSSFWFTLILGIAVIILGLMAKPLKRLPHNTVSDVLATAYGEKIIPWASIFVIFGMLINVVSNLLAARSLLKALTPFSPEQVTVTAGLIMIIYIVFGGIWSGSWIGLFKTFLIYTLIITSVGLVFFLLGEPSEVVAMVQKGGGLNLFARGVGKEIAAGISVIIGVLSTQTYLQAIFSGKDPTTSKKGAIISGLLIIPVGIMGFLIGLYMRFHHPEIDSAQALPLFILYYLPPWLGGAMFGGLLLSVIGGGAGLTLGISTVIGNDLYLRLINPRATERRTLRINRVSIVLIIGLAICFVLGGMTILMNELTYLSMGLRGAAIFLPLMGALFMQRLLPDWIGYGLLFVGSGSVGLWFFFGHPAIDPVYPALGANLVLLAVGLFLGRKKVILGRKF